MYNSEEACDARVSSSPASKLKHFLCLSGIQESHVHISLCPQPVKSFDNLIPIFCEAVKLLHRA